MENVEHFNTLVGLIFDRLYKSFPVPLELGGVDFAEAMSVTATLVQGREMYPRDAQFDLGELMPTVNFQQFFDATTSWLAAEGFTRGQGWAVQGDVVLTSRALTALNALPSGLDQTLGSKLAAATKGTGTEIGRAAISEVVGQVIGAVARNLF